MRYRAITLPIDLVFADGDGGTSNTEIETINVGNPNDAPDLVIANPDLARILHEYGAHDG